MNYRQFRDPAELGGYVFLKMPFLVLFGWLTVWNKMTVPKWTSEGEWMNFIPSDNLI